MLEFFNSLEKLDQFLISDGYRQVSPVPGKYSGILVWAYSTGNNSGVVNVDTLGTIKGTLRGQIEAFNTDYSRLKALNDLDFFAKTFVVANGSKLNTVFYVPFTLPGDNKNVLEIVRKDDLSIEFLNVGSTNIGTGGTIQVFGVKNELGTAGYLLKTLNATYQMPVGTGTPVPLAQYSNISRLLLESDTNLEFLQFSIDGDVKYNADKDILNSFTQMFNVTEASGSVDYLDLKTGDGSLESFLNHKFDLKLNIKTAASAIKLLVQEVSINDEANIVASQETNQSLVSQKLRYKSSRVQNAFNNIIARKY